MTVSSERVLLGWLASCARRVDIRVLVPLPRCCIIVAAVDGSVVGGAAGLAGDEVGPFFASPVVGRCRGPRSIPNPESNLGACEGGSSGVGFVNRAPVADPRVRAGKGGDPCRRAPLAAGELRRRPSCPTSEKSARQRLRRPPIGFERTSRSRDTWSWSDIWGGTQHSARVAWRYVAQYGDEAHGCVERGAQWGAAAAPAATFVGAFLTPLAGTVFEGVAIGTGCVGGALGG
jgi:hypothetical protein